jgi:hypothetical protein
VHCSSAIPQRGSEPVFEKVAVVQMTAALVHLDVSWLQKWNVIRPKASQIPFNVDLLFPFSYDFWRVKHIFN